MADSFYAADETRAARVNDLFATIAPRYDLINDLQSFGLHRWWKRKMIALAKVTPGERALDLCCGTGDVAFALARAGVVVTGLDFSQPMLAVAQQRDRQFHRVFAARRRALHSRLLPDTHSRASRPLGREFDDQ